MPLSMPPSSRLKTRSRADHPLRRLLFVRLPYLAFAMFLQLARCSVVVARTHHTQLHVSTASRRVAAHYTTQYRLRGQQSLVAAIPNVQLWKRRRISNDAAEKERQGTEADSSQRKTARPTPLAPSKRFVNTLRRATSNMISAVGFVASTTTALATNRAQFRRWKPSVQALENFLKTTGIDLELSQSLNIRLLDHAVVLGKAQSLALAGRDIRDLALSSRQRLDAPSNEECLRYMRYATAAYGESMIRAAEMDVKGTFDNRMSALTGTRISEHIGVPEDDIVLMDVDYDGDTNHLRHFVAVDHENRKVVLAIRGTFSLSEVVVDVAGFSRHFCGGEAHAEMANMAEEVWKVAGPTVRELLRNNKKYEFIITGHSLGAGAASLLNILCHKNLRREVVGRKTRCFAYASPPVFTPIDLAGEAARSCVNFIHERDVVPFLSVDSVRHFFASTRAIEIQERGWVDRMKHVTGYSDPDEDLLKAIWDAEHERLPPKAGAPILVIPAATNLWIREKEGSGRYDVKVCDSRRLAELGIQIDPNMLSHHFPQAYERALHNLD